MADDGLQKIAVRVHPIGRRAPGNDIGLHRTLGHVCGLGTQEDPVHEVLNPAERPTYGPIVRDQRVEAGRKGNQAAVPGAERLVRVAIQLHARRAGLQLVGQ